MMAENSEFFDNFHLNCVTRQEIFSCEKCDEKFTYKAMLDRHMWTHKNETFGHTCSKFKSKCLMEQLLHCNYCDKVFPCNVMTRHVRQIHFHESFSCVLCEKFYMTPEEYSKHVYDHHSGVNGEGKKKSCVKCDEIHEIYKNKVGFKYFCDYCILVRDDKQKNFNQG